MSVLSRQALGFIKLNIPLHMFYFKLYPENKWQCVRSNLIDKMFQSCNEDAIMVVKMGPYHHRH